MTCSFEGRGPTCAGEETPLILKDGIFRVCANHAQVLLEAGIITAERP